MLLRRSEPGWSLTLSQSSVSLITTGKPLLVPYSLILFTKLLGCDTRSLRGLMILLSVREQRQQEAAPQQLQPLGKCYTLTRMYKTLGQSQSQALPGRSDSSRQGLQGGTDGALVKSCAL